MTTLETLSTSKAPEKRSIFGKSITRTSGALVLTAALFTAGCGSSESDTSNESRTTSSAPAVTETAPTATKVAEPGDKVLLEGSKIKEVQQFGADTFNDYKTASGVGPEMPVGTEVIVDCLANGPLEAAPSVKGKWYHLTGPAQYAGYFAAANTFENGDTSGPVSEQPAVDPQVPACP